MKFSKVKTVFHLLFAINWGKTLRFNLHYFTIGTALRLPVWIYRHTVFNKLEGTVQLSAPVHSGMIRVGVHNIGSKDGRFPQTVWHVAGAVIVGDNVSIGRGTGISVAATGVLTLGNNFVQNGASEMICHRSITFGDDCLVSWDVLMMDTDLHYILNVENEQINLPQPIHICNHVWIACRSTILKGVYIADNTVIASGSVVTKSSDQANVILSGGGGENRILKKEVKWSNQLRPLCNE